MLRASRNQPGVDRAIANRTKIGKRAKRKRLWQLESLESRTLLSYTIAWNSTNSASVVESGGGDSFTVSNAGGGLLAYSIDGGTPSTTWGTSPSGTLSASTATTLSILVQADNSAVIDGTATSSASSVQAHLNLSTVLPGNVADSVTVNDSDNTGTNSYTVNGLNGTVTGSAPNHINVTLVGISWGGGVTLDGGAGRNSISVPSTVTDEPVFIAAGPANGNTVTVGSGNVLTGLMAPVAVTDPTTLTINDSADTTHGDATFDDLSGNLNAPYEVTGLGNAPIEWGTGVSAVNFTGGTNGTGGVVYDINNTQSGTTTTITGGTHTNLYNLSTSAESLSNLLGPVSIHGGSAGDTIVLADQDDTTPSITYTVTSTTVTSPSSGFGGLSFSNLGTSAALFLHTADTTGGTTNITSTAANVATTIDGGTSANVYNLSSTGAAGGLTNVAGPVTINGGGAGDSISLFDQRNFGSGATYAVTDVSVNRNTSFSGTFGGLTYGGLGIGGDLTLHTTNSSGSVTNITSTASSMTTVDGGTNASVYNLGSASVVGGLSNLPGPVVINAGTLRDSIFLYDQDNSATVTYTVTGTKVTSTGFGGLTYGGLGTGGSISLFTADSSDNDTEINGTANNVTTAVTGSDDSDVVDVNATGTGGVLNITTGDGGAPGNTVNVVTNSEPVYIASTGVTTVNIGSTGGPGSMAGIGAAIDVSNSVAVDTALNFHDENDTTGQTWTLINQDAVLSGTVAVTSALGVTTYEPQDLSALTVNGGSGGNLFVVNDTSMYYPTTLNTGTGADTTDVFATGANTLTIQGQAGLDTVTLGALAGTGMQDLNGSIAVLNTNSFTTLNLDDSQDPNPQTGLLTDNGSTGTVTGLSPATINYTDADINSTDHTVSSLTISLSENGGSDFTFDGTLTSTFFTPILTTLNGGSGGFNQITVNGTNSGSVLDIDKGTGDFNTVDVNATSAGSVVNITGTGSFDTVNINFAAAAGPVNIDETATGGTELTIDLSTDGLSHEFVLYSNPITGISTLHDDLGNVADITYVTASIKLLTIDTDPGTPADPLPQSLTVDFGGIMPGDGGNPIPTASTPGMIYNAGGTGALDIEGKLTTGVFASEVQNAEDPDDASYGPAHYGDIDFDDALGNATSLAYSGLSPCTDTAPATDYTFNDFGYPDQSFIATYAAPYLQFASIPTPPAPTNFETTDISNKVNVTFTLPALYPGQPNTGAYGQINIPTASAGLTSLTFNMTTGNENTVDVLATPAGVATTLNDSTASDTINVDGKGVAAGTTLVLYGGANPDVLNYDAGGLVPTVTNPAPQVIDVSVPGAGTVETNFYNPINIVDVAPIAPVMGTPIVINSVAGFQLVGSLVGTFTFPLPAGVTQLIPASDFTATITWGDGSTAAGVITLAANGTYDITGTHTYAGPVASTPTSLTVNYIGSTVTIPSPAGVPITSPVNITLPATTAGSTSTATVTDAPLAVTAYPISGTEGIPIAPTSTIIATFVDGSGAHPGTYTAVITFTASDGTVYTVPPADIAITQSGSSAAFTVTFSSASFALPEEGTYQVAVKVTSTVDGGPYSGASIAVIADAPLTAGPPIVFPPVSAGTTFSGVVATFTDANPVAPISDFSALIDWGDGSAQSAGAITQPGGVGTAFDVSGTHTYAYSGVYTITTYVTDIGGSKVTITNTIDVEYPNLYLQGNNFLVTLTPGGSDLDITVDGVLTSYIAADVHNIYLFGAAGTDSLVVNDTNGAIAAPIYFYATGGGPNSLQLMGGTATSDTYAPGAAPGAGSSVIVIAGVTQTVNFTNLSPVFDSVGGPLTVNANNADNAINYQEGDTPALVPSPSWGQVSVDTSEAINFMNKASLAINGLAGGNNINLNNPNAPTGLATIAINGGVPGASNTLVVNGTTGADTITYAPTSASAGSVAVSGLPTVTFSGITSLAVNGQSGGDSLTVAAPAGSQATVTPGSAVDSGTVSLGSSGAPLSFSNLGPAGSSLTISGATSLVYSDTTGSDTFSVTGSAVAGHGTVSLTSNSTPPVAQIPVDTIGVTNLVLNGVNATDMFVVIASLTLPYTAIALNGAASDPPVAVLAGNGTSVTATLGNTFTTVTGGGLGTVTLNGVGMIDLSNGSGPINVQGISVAPNYFTVIPTGLSTTSTQDNGMGPWLNTITTGTLTVGGVTGNLDTVTIMGTAGNNAFKTTSGASPTISSSDQTITLNTTGLAALDVNAGPGAGSLMVDSSAGAFPLPIFYSGGGAGSLILTQTGGATAASDTYSPGPADGSGTSTIAYNNGTQTVSFTGLSPVLDLVPATTLTVNAGSTAAGINYTTGSVAANGLVSVAGQESVEFSNKTNLVINAAATGAAIDVNNPNVPTGLASVTVNGSGATAGDTLTINGTAGLDNIDYTSSSATPGIGLVTVAPSTGPALPPVTFTAISNLAINGGGGNDNMTVTTPSGPNALTLSPGTAVDSGTVTVTRTVGAPSSATPLSFSNLGAGGSLTFENSGSPAPDTLVYNGTLGNDTFAVAPTTGVITLTTASGLGFPQIPVSAPGVANLVLNAFGGTTTFDVAAPQSYTSIALDGDAVANLTGDSSAITTTLANSVTIVTGGGLGTVTLTAVSAINLNADGGAVTVNGATGQVNDIEVTPTAPALSPAPTVSAQIQDNGSGPMIYLIDPASLTASGNADGTDTVTVNGTNKNDRITVAGTSGNPTVEVNDGSNLLLVSVTTVTAALVVNSGLGTDSVVVDSSLAAVTVPITYIGGGGAGDTLTLTGGSATSDTYTPGSIPGSGISTLVFASGTESVAFAGLQPVLDVVAGPLVVDGTGGNDTINYSAAPTTTADGYVSVNSAEPVEFANKATLTINGEGGNNTITVNNPNIPTGLAAITVNGASTAGNVGTNTLIVNANGAPFTSADINATSTTVLAIPGAIPVPINYATIANVQIINTKDALTGTPVSPITAVANGLLNNVVLASFQYTDLQPPPEVSSPTSFLATINWGDGTVASPDLTAGTIVELAPYNGVVTFQVLGTHTYTTQGTFTVTVSIYDNGSSRTFTPLSGSVPVTITANPGATTVVTPVVTNVASAPITATGAPTNQVEGIMATTLVATIVDPNPGASVANYPSGSISINWGDGTPVTNTSPPIVVTQVGTQPNGVVFEVFAPHTYAVAGNFTVIVSITRSSIIGGVPTPGSSAVAVSNEIVASSALIPVAAQPTITTDEATTYPTPEFGTAPVDNPYQVFNGPVAFFTDTNTGAPRTPPSAVSQEYKAIIDWGDETPQSTGTVTYNATLAEYVVSGTHTYATSGVNGGVGHYPITVYISTALPVGSPSSVSPSTLTITNTANVTDNPIAVTGILNPSSDSGKNNLDNITNVTQPNFYGTVLAAVPNGTSVPDPYAHVTLYANGVPVGTTQAGSNGVWSITSNLLAQGTYTITASATDQFGQTVSPIAMITSSLVVDTTPPVITSLSFDRFDATLTVTFQAGLAGMDLASITNSAFYHISAKPLVSDVHVPNLILPTSISYTPGALPTDPVVVNVVFNKGRTFRGGAYEVIINSGTGNSGIQDVAGNALSGYFYGSFPTGDGLPGGDFVAEILTFHNKVLPFIPISAGYSPPPKGIDPPAGSSHAGKTHKTVHAKTKAAIDRKTAAQTITAQKTKLGLFDEALRELAAESKAKRDKK